MISEINDKITYNKSHKTHNNHLNELIITNKMSDNKSHPSVNKVTSHWVMMTPSWVMVTPSWVMLLLLTLVPWGYCEEDKVEVLDEPFTIQSTPSGE